MTDSIEKVLYSKADIEEAVSRVAHDINRDYKDSGKKLVLVCILKGSLIFCSDLMRKIDRELTVEFMKASSYGAGTTSQGTINIQLDLTLNDPENTDIIIVEDIIDSGHTLSLLVKNLKDRGAASVKTVTLLNNPYRRAANIEPDYCGIKMTENAFVVGYGLDYNEFYRNLDYIGVLKPEIYQK